MIKTVENGKIVCIIPARAGSKRLINKNTRPLNGKPLIAWTLEEAKKSLLIDRIIVSTDDEAVSNISGAYGIEVVKRPEELAADEAATADVVIHVLGLLKQRAFCPGHVILLQCTSPLRTAKHIDEALRKYLDSKEDVDSLISVSREEHPPWWSKTIDKSGFLFDTFEYDRQKYSRSQDFPDTYRVNGAIYIARTKKLLEFKGFQMERTLSYVMEPRLSIDIDTETDFMFAELVMNSLRD